MKKLNELDKLYKQFEKAAKEMTGYPLCQLFDYSVTVHIPLLRRGSERNQATDVCAIAG